MRILLLSVLLFTCFSCDSKKEITTTSSFFSLKSYFKEEAKLKAGISLLKTVKVDAKTETQTLKAPNLEEEFSIFSNFDINKLAWVDKYVADSTFIDKELTKISYTTTAPKLKIKKLDIDFQGGKVSNILIESKTKNTVYKLEQTLNYQPNKGYSIKTSQNTKVANPQIFEIDVEFLKTD